MPIRIRCRTAYVVRLCGVAGADGTVPIVNCVWHRSLWGHRPHMFVAVAAVQGNVVHVGAPNPCSGYVILLVFLLRLPNLSQSVLRRVGCGYWCPPIPSKDGDVAMGRGRIKWVWPRQKCAFGRDFLYFFVFFLCRNLADSGCAVEP